MYERNLIIYVKDMIENMEKSERFVKDLNQPTSILESILKKYG